MIALPVPGREAQFGALLDALDAVCDRLGFNPTNNAAAEDKSAAAEGASC